MLTLAVSPSLQYRHSRLGQADHTSSGTNTDGVLIDVTRLQEPSRGVLAHYKAPTTTEVSKGIENAVREVLKIASVSPSEVASVSIGTTAFINAVLEADARRLAKVAVIRMSSVYTRQCPPFIDFPKSLRILTEGHVGYVDGGFESEYIYSFLPNCDLRLYS